MRQWSVRATRREFVAAVGAVAATPLAQTLQSVMADPDLAKAMNALRAAIPVAAADPERPTYHFHPPANWNNDPNGTLFYKGWHHLFYQLNPFAPTGGNQHWGHARSRDLINWEHLPIAIGPSSDRGERAIFSGGAIVAADGRPRIIYTSIGHPQPEQWMAIPEDDELVRWKKSERNPVLTAAAHGRLEVEQWRDPFLFSERGATYMVCGGNTKVTRGGAGQVQLYRAANADLTRWIHLGAVFQALERETYNIECPNLFKLDGRWVLIISPHRACEYYVGEFDLEARRFIPETHGILDAGDAYASNISRDEGGRTLLWLWGRTRTPRDRGWNGVMVMPRVLSIAADGALRQQVPAEFATLRGPLQTFADISLDQGARVLEDIAADAAEVEAEFVVRGVGAFGFELRPSPTEEPSTTVAIQRGMLTVGSARAYIGTAERYRVRLFLDKRCMEVYVNDGTAALYTALDGAPRSRVLAVFTRGVQSEFGPAGSDRGAGVGLKSLKAWRMSPASFSLDRFHL
jgi:beta-fructofuranosidase